MNKETSHKKRTRNRCRNTIKGSGGEGGSRGGDTRVRKKKSDVVPKFIVPEIITTKPAIESSNPFFIAVCAPETYKPRLGGGGGSGGGGGEEKEKRVNVFLRQRPRSHTTGPHSSGSRQTNYPNRFIQHSQNNSILTPLENVVEPIVTSNDLQHFPSLGSGVSSSAQTKLNFKEMVMRNTATGAGTGTGTGTTGAGTGTRVGTATGTGATGTATGTGATATARTTNEVKVAYPRISPSLSSNNIFLAAFQAPRSDDDCDGDGDDDDTIENNTIYQQRVVSSALIDSCDKKYDKLYR